MTSLGVFIAALAALPFLSGAVEYEIASCDDLSSVDDQTVTALTITSDTIACDNYTRFPVRNTLTITATVPDVTFSSFSLEVLGDLTVEPDVTFQNVVDAPTSGGALYVQLSASATFMGTAHFQDLSVKEQLYAGNSSWFSIPKNGGAIHNEGYLVFEQDASFLRCEEKTLDSVNEAFGGAISNIANGTIWFKGTLTMEENDADGFFAGDGGAIYNKGDITVEGEAYFRDNTAGQGGVIAQGPWANMIFNSFVTFFDNHCFQLFGGVVANFGGEMTFNAGVLFDDNYASSSGEGGFGGGLYNENGGVVTFIGTTTFRENWARVGGAIYLKIDKPSHVDTWETPIIIYPEDPADLIFEDNNAYFCPDIGSDAENEPCISAY